ALPISALQGAAGRLHAADPHLEPRRRQRADVNPRAGREEREDRAGAEAGSGEEGRREEDRSGFRRPGRRREEAGQAEEGQEDGRKERVISDLRPHEFFWLSVFGSPGERRFLIVRIREPRAKARG